MDFVHDDVFDGVFGIAIGVDPLVRPSLLFKRVDAGRILTVDRLVVLRLIAGAYRKFACLAKPAGDATTRSL